MFASGLCREKGIEGDYAGDFGKRLIQRARDILLQFQREMPVDFLRDVEDLDKASFLILVKVDDICDFSEFLLVVVVHTRTIALLVAHYAAPLYKCFSEPVVDVDIADGLTYIEFTRKML